MDLEMLIKRAVNFDLDAQKQLFELFYHRMSILCMNYAKNPTDAEDLLYSSYQSFFKTLHKITYGDEDSLMKWLTGIVYINSKEHQRKKLRWTPLEEEEETDGPLMPDVEDRMDHARLLSLVMQHKH